MVGKGDSLFIVAYEGDEWQDTYVPIPANSAVRGFGTVKFHAASLRERAMLIGGYDREGNEIARYTVKTVGDAAQIAVTATDSVIKADGRDVSLVNIELRDKDGNFAILSNNHLKVTVEGEGHLLSMDNGCGTDHTMGRCPERDAYYGRLFLVVQSERGKAGEIRIRVEGGGLEEGGITIRTES